MKMIINEETKGFLFKNGKFVKMLDAGKYSMGFGKVIYPVKITNSKIVVKGFDDISIFKNDEEFKKITIEKTIKSGEIAIHLVDGVFEELLTFGHYFFWNINKSHSFITIDLTKPEFANDFPSFLFSYPLMNPYVCKIEVDTKQKGLLYFDNKFDRILEPGIYYFVKGKVNVRCDVVNASLQTQDIVGQEILTSDKVSLRINCVCNFRIVDFIKVKTEIDDVYTQLYISTQLALRSFVSEKTLDEILANKKEISSYILTTLQEKAKSLYIEVIDAAVKDIILPGEIRDIMNTVLVAEKRAQANVITRREEVASTRSLLNTAKLMDENATLYKLKELEYIERICEKVNSINLNGNGDILSQLTATLSGNHNKK